MDRDFEIETNRLLTAGSSSDRTEISVFEQKISDFRGFCEEK
jgi:hypothetical protein